MNYAFKKKTIVYHNPYLANKLFDDLIEKIAGETISSFDKKNHCIEVKTVSGKTKLIYVSNCGICVEEENGYVEYIQMPKRFVKELYGL